MGNGLEEAGESLADAGSLSVTLSASNDDPYNSGSLPDSLSFVEDLPGDPLGLPLPQPGYNRGPIEGEGWVFEIRSDHKGQGQRPAACRRNNRSHNKRPNFLNYSVGCPEHLIGAGQIWTLTVGGETMVTNRQSNSRGASPLPAQALP